MVVTIKTFTIYKYFISIYMTEAPVLTKVGGPTITWCFTFSDILRKVSIKDIRKVFLQNRVPYLSVCQQLKLLRLFDVGTLD